MTRIKTRQKRQKQSRPKGDSVAQYTSDAWSLAKRTAVGLNEIRKLINIETKFCDSVVGSTAVTPTGYAGCISRLAQGLTSTDRIGDSIKLQHVELRGRVVINAAATTSLIRVMLVRDLDGYGTPATCADVLEYATFTSAPLSPEKFNKRDRFSILYDETFAMQGSTSDGTSSFPFYYNTAHGGHVMYLGTTATGPSDGKGSVYVMAVSDEATNTPTIAFDSRLLYTDD